MALRGFSVVIEHNVDEVANSFGAAVSGIARYDRSRTADGRTVSLWTGEGMRRQGMITSWRRSRHRMFVTQGASTGRAWRDYTKDEKPYAAIKRSIFGRRVGRSSGDLNRWIRGQERLFPSFVAGSHRDNVARQGRHSLLVGSAVPYAGRLHTGGGKIPRRLGGGTSPARPLLTLSQDLMVSWERDLVAFVQAHTSSIGTRASRASILAQAAR